MNEVAVIEQRAVTLTAAQVKGQVQLVQQVMQSVMKEGVHYGVIPGTDKPSLYKPGAEVLMTTFRIAVEPKIEDLSTPDEIRYRIHCVGTHQTSGTIMGTGIGECSSNEEKYKWKRANNREFENTPEDRRRVKYGYDKNKRQEYEINQVRTEPADVANTILKMAKKRALVDFTLTALAASDCFNQDLEEMDESLRDSILEGEQQKRTVRQPRPKQEAKGEERKAADPNQKLAPGQIKVVEKAIARAVEAGAKITTEAVCAQFKTASLAEIPFKDVNEVLKWISEQAPE